MQATTPPELIEQILADTPAQAARELLRACYPEGEAAADERARLLAHFSPDAQSVAAALLMEAHRAGALDAQAEEALDPGVAALLRGMERMAVIESFLDHGEESNREGLRKMLLATVEDIRVVFLLLAERLRTTRQLKHVEGEARAREARLNFDIFAPLANRLGLGQVKWELEDLSLHALEPETYREIARFLDEKRVEREAYIQKVKAILAHHLGERAIDADIAGRPKHIYSIWKKMRRKGVDFHHLFDVRAVRVLVETVEQCYAVLSLAHELWEPVAGEYDDYISNPKPNGYRSLHTAVIGPEEKPLEVQIRTHAMHQESEMGVAAHWRYKEGGRHDASLERKIAWLRQLMEWQGEGEEGHELTEQLHHQVFDERVYVFTPRGAVLDLPRGATPLDFAYTVHTQVGHRCKGAKVNGRIVPLHTPLATGDQVEILTAKQGEPSRDWLDDPRYLVTRSARDKVRLWFREQSFDRHLADGKGLCDKEFARLGHPVVELEALARRFHFPTVDKFLAAIGRGDVPLGQLGNAIQQLAPHREEEPPQHFIAPPPPRRSHHGEGVAVEGIEDLLTHMAGCCHPAPGDAIVGFITLGHGVSVHRAGCPNAAHLLARHPERSVEVAWGSRLAPEYEAQVWINSDDRKGLLRDITSILGELKINVLEMRSRSDRSGDRVITHCTLRVRDAAHLDRALERIGALPNVREARRA